MIDDVRIEADEDGWHLILIGGLPAVAEKWLSTPNGYELNLGLPQEVAEQLLAQVEPIREWVEEGRRERAAYDSASPEERAAVLGGTCGYADDGESLREQADLSRKAERENRP